MNPRLLLLFLCTSLWLAAHPMGNFSISHYARLEPKPHGLDLIYALDVAEIPTFELLRDWKLERTSPREQLDAKALSQARTWVANLVIAVDGKPVSAKVESADLVIADGAGNLPVARITAKVRINAKPGTLTYEDRNYPDRAGWKEIVIASAKNVELKRASHPDKDVSQALTAYPADPTVAPPQDVRAQMEWKALPASPTPVERGKPSLTLIEPVPQPRPVVPSTQQQTSPAVQQDIPGTVQKGDSLSQLLRRGDLGISAILVALALAFGFGAAHALSPGHGKTIVAAYLVGSRGTFKHALFLGAMVTFTHTVSVFLLGLGTLFLSKYIVPDKIYPILGAVSGLTIVVIGASLFFKRLRRLMGHGHGHGHGHSHGHSHSHDHGHSHAGHSHTHEEMHKLEHAHSHAAAHAHGHAHTHPHPHEHKHAEGHSHDHPHHDHGHAHDHGHHHDHDHHHGPGGHSHVPEGEVTFGSLVGLAVSGGMVPCPSALVLLLSSIALGRVGLGLLLLTSFSLGLSLVLIAIGCAVLYAKHLLPDTPKVTGSPLFQMLPVVSAAVITIVGLFMTAAALGIVRPIGV